MTTDEQAECDLFRDLAAARLAELTTLLASHESLQVALETCTLQRDAFFSGREMMRQERDELIAERELCPDWRCQTCGCLWRDNHNGTVSLFDVSQKACNECEGQPIVAACERVPMERDDDLPADVRRKIMRAAIGNGRISYWYLCDLWRQGRREGRQLATACNVFEPPDEWPAALVCKTCGISKDGHQASHAHL